MKVIIESIRYEDKPLVWDYNEKDNVLTCLYQFPWHKTVVNKEDTVLTFAEVSEIQYSEDGTAFIPNAKPFLDKNSHTALSSDTPKSTRHHTSPRGDASASPRKTLKDAYIPETRTPRSAISPRATGSPRGLFSPTGLSSIAATQFLSTAALIPHDQDIWRATLVYLGCMEDTSARILNTRKFVIHSIRTLFSHHQLMNNGPELYPKKKLLIEAVKSLFDDILAPHYHRVTAGAKPYIQFQVYFQNIIKEAMTITDYDISPTVAESYVALDDQSMAIMFEKESRAKYKLRGLFYLVEEIDVEKLCADKAVQEELLSFKRRIGPVRENILAQLKKIQELMINLVDVEKPCRENDKIIEKAIEHSQAELFGFFSFKTFMLNKLHFASAIKGSKKTDFIARLLPTVNKALKNDFCYHEPYKKILPLIMENDHDLYISNNLKMLIEAKLDDVCIKKTTDDDVERLKGEIIQVVRTHFETVIENMSASSSDDDHLQFTTTSSSIVK